MLDGRSETVMASDNKNYIFVAEFFFLMFFSDVAFAGFLLLTAP